jgi:prepilin-type N-terminal cleavage/methylation domain-containing protein
MKKSFYKNAGFTLIEMIVSLGVFSVVVTTTVGAILVLVNTNLQLQAEQSVMTNLSFALDAMTREMRTGYKYYCDERPNYAAGGAANFFDDANTQEDLNDDVSDCDERSQSLQGVSFFEGGESLTKSVTGARRITYFFDENEKKIFRRVGGEPAQTNGTDELSDGSDDAVQPTITIYIEAKDVDDSTGKSYYVQTTVTQRTLDL